MKKIYLFLIGAGVFLFGCQLVSQPVVVRPTPPQVVEVTLPSVTTIPPTIPAPSPTPTLEPTPAGLAISQPITITTIQMVDPVTGWGIGRTKGSADRLVKTGDGGATWGDVTPAQAFPTGNEPTAALGFFKNADQAWAIYSSSPGEALPAAEVIWRTNDGGKSWQASQPLDLSGLNENFWPSHLQFVDDQNGWLLAHVGVGMNHDYVALYQSMDGGATWTRLLDPYNDGGIQSCYKNAMLFTDARHGWLTGTCNGVAAGVLIFRTADGGHTWETVNLPQPSGKASLFTDLGVECSSEYPVFLTSQEGFLAVRCSHYAPNPADTLTYLYSTQDGGELWKPVAYPGGALKFFDGRTGLAFGKEIYQTKDGGESWAKISVVSWEGAFTFPDQQRGWAVARSDDQVALVSSQDGGQYWTLLEPLLVR